MVDSVTQTNNLAKLYQQEVTSVIGATVSQSPHVGYLDQNKTALEVRGTLTQQDNINYFRFTYRKGTSIQLKANMSAGVRVQLLDGSGTRVLADSGGTSSLKKAFADFASGDLNLKNGNYAFKLSYSQGVSKTKDLNYDVSVFSGSTYAAKYKTMAYPTTVLYQLQSGGSVGYSSAAKTASLMMDQQGGEDTNIIDYLA